MLTRATTYRLPDPYVPCPFVETNYAIAAAFSASAAWNSANLASFVPYSFPVAASIYSISFYANNGTGNYDIGLYQSNLVKVQSQGTTAMTAAGKKTLTLTRDFKVCAGDVIYVAVAFSSTSQQSIMYTGGGTRFNALAGIGQQASAVPLPDPFVPAAGSTLTRIPIIMFGIR